jgi:hypothetical protein
LDDGGATAEDDDAYAVKATAVALAPGVAAGAGVFFSTFGLFLPALGMVKTTRVRARGRGRRKKRAFYEA